MSSSSDSDASSSASESDDDSLSPADLAAINAFVGDDEWSDAGSACSDSSGALAREVSRFERSHGFGAGADADADSDDADAAAPSPKAKQEQGAAKPADKQAKCKARRQRQRERAKAKKKELQQGGGGPPTLFVRAFNGDLDRRELTKLAEATLGEGAVTKVRAVGAPGKAASAYVELREGSVVSTSAQKLHKKQLPGGAQLSVKPALDKKGLEAVVKKGAKRKAEPSAKAEGKRRAVLKKKAGKETAAHSCREGPFQAPHHLQEGYRGGHPIPPSPPVAPLHTEASHATVCSSPSGPPSQRGPRET